MIQRIQLKRKKGWRLPEGAMKVDRSTPWGNSYKIVKDSRPLYSSTYMVVDGVTIYGMGLSKKEATQMAIEYFRRYVECMGSEWRNKWLAPLRKATVLACWCKLSEPCHCDALIEFLEKGPV